MPVTARSCAGPRRSCRSSRCRPPCACRLPSSGLTLVEVLVATAILLLTCTAVTSVIVASARAGGASRRIETMDAALIAEAARLRALPLFAPLPVDWPVRHEMTVPSAMGELFPHAHVDLNTGDTRFLALGECAGAFETSVVVQGTTVRRTAWMACCDASGWRPVPVTTLAGWQAWGGVAMPAEALLVRLEAILATGAAPGGARAGGSGLTLVLTSEGSPASGDPGALEDDGE